MFIYFLRHASAGEQVSNPAKDEKRPLDKLGVEQCRYVGHFLASIDGHVDLIISSSLKRATQTASLVGNEISYEGKIQVEPSLRPEAEFAAFRDMLQSVSDLDAVMVVGHNPTIAAFLSLLVTGGKSDRAVEMKKGSLARVDYSPKRAQLNWLLTPRLAKAAYASSTAKSRPKTSRK